MNNTSSYSSLDLVRREVSRLLDPSRRAEYGQFMTPNSIAAFMASLFSYEGEIKLLDPGAGIGSLTAAFLENSLKYKADVFVDAWEIDKTLSPYLEGTLKHWQTQTSNRIEYQIHSEDFIEYASFMLSLGGGGAKFTHVITNPPYKKIHSSSMHRGLLKMAGIETVNLYSAFIALCIGLLKDKGELVAIVPRSFCNGTYYLPFRELLVKNTSIKQIHLFTSRAKNFNDDAVLQENIIIHLVKSGSFDKIKISTSFDAEFADYAEHYVPYSNVIDKDTKNKFIHIPLQSTDRDLPSICSHNLNDLNLEISTGPVVDFRAADSLVREITEDAVPLLYSFNFTNGKLTWPKEHKKANAIRFTQDTKKSLFPNGNYVLVKRFSSKEERKRIVAYFLAASDLDYDYIGIENHLNVFHFGKAGIDEFIAKGLTIFLNSTVIDNYFRIFSGHTQVNATDLRAIKYPNLETLAYIGKSYEKVFNDQLLIDNLIGELI